MENNKLKVKDLVNIGIFSALYMAIAMVVMIPVGIAPILWLLWPGIAGLFGGVFFTLLLTKVPKMGASLLLALISGILFFATGECTWVIIVTFAIAGLLAEVMRKVLGYKSFKGIALAGGFCAIGFIGSPLPMWLFQESYMKSILQKLEFIYVPLMLSASTTADELSQAITARGIDNPCAKTCAVPIRFHVQDYVLCLAAVILVIIAFVLL